MSNPSLKSPYQWEEEDEFNLLTAVLEIATESAESYDPSINLFDRVSKAMNKSLGYEEILNKVHDLQQRYRSHNNAIKKDRIFMISDQIWGRHSRKGESDEGCCKTVTENREMKGETEVEDVHLVMKGKQEQAEAKCRKRVKQEEPEQRCMKRVKQEEPEQKCMNCDTKTTPQWRIGPMGPKTLCNACGLRYRKGRLEPDDRPFMHMHSKYVKKVGRCYKARKNRDRFMPE